MRRMHHGTINHPTISVTFAPAIGLFLLRDSRCRVRITVAVRVGYQIRCRDGYKCEFSSVKMGMGVSGRHNGVSFSVLTIPQMCLKTTARQKKMIVALCQSLDFWPNLPHMISTATLNMKRVFFYVCTCPAAIRNIGRPAFNQRGVHWWH